MAILGLLDNNGVIVQKWEIADQPISVGRDETADIVIPDQTLSRQHFLLMPDAEGCQLRDLDSQNGTWVDGQKAAVSRLRGHDCIVAGQTVFMFLDDKVAAAFKAPAGLAALVAQSLRDSSPVAGK